MTKQTPIEMAREVAASVIEQQPETGDGFHMRNTAAGVRAGAYDQTTVMQASLAMHARLTAEHQAAVAELVECLAAAFADPMRLVISHSAMNETGALLAKHRAPDAFETWAEGLIDG